MTGHWRMRAGRADLMLTFFDMWSPQKREYRPVTIEARRYELN